MRKESGAKVKLHDPVPGDDSGDRMLEISGALAQVQAAQALVVEILSAPGVV